jgi:hypothetical protein
VQGRIRSVFALSRATGKAALPENESVSLPRPLRLSRRGQAGRLQGMW